MALSKSKLSLDIFIRLPSHLLVAFSAWLGRIITSTIQVVSVRILTQSLGTEQYAVFVLIYGLMGWCLLADLGIGVSLQNYISELRARRQTHDDYIAVAGIVTIGLLIFSIFLLFFITPYIAPLFLRHFGFLSDAEKNRLFFAGSALFIAIGIGEISYRVWYALQKGYLANILSALASITGLLGVLLVAHSKVQDKLLWSLMLFIAPGGLLAILSFFWQLSAICGHVWGKNWGIFSSLMKRALKFWFFALMATIVLHIDYIIISQFLSPTEIVIYGISTKIFTLFFFIYNSILLALWPICTEAISQNKWDKVSTFLKKYLRIGIMMMVVFTVLLMWLMPTIINVLMPDKPVFIPVLFIIVLGVYYIIRVWTDTYAMILQSMSDMRQFWIFVPFQAFASVLLQRLLVPKIGIYGVVLGLIGSFILTVMWALPLAVKRHVKGKDRTGYEH